LEIVAAIDVDHSRSKVEFLTDLDRAFRERGIEPHPYELEGFATAMGVRSGVKRGLVGRTLDRLRKSTD